MPSDNPIRVGLLGCASIAKKNVIAILQEQSGCVVTAVASRSQSKAYAFVQEMFANQRQSSSSSSSIAVLDSYDDLIQHPEVDALYIPLPTKLHKEWVLKALKAGKHVLLEKPVAVSCQEFHEMLKVAKANHCYLQDGTMFVHHPRTQSFLDTVHNTSVLGTIQRVEAGFSFCGDESFFQNDIRVKQDGDPLGCLGDLGWYVVRAALLIMGEKGPVKSAQVIDYKKNRNGVPIDATCFVKFQDDKVLSFHCGFSAQFRQYIKVVGTTSWAEMDDFVLPKKHPVRYTVQSMNLTDHDLIAEHTSVLLKEFDGPVQEVLMWKTFSQIVQSFQSAGGGGGGGGGGWHGSSAECLKANRLAQLSSDTQKVLDMLMESITKGGTRVEL